MESRVIDKVRKAYAVLLQWEADDAAGVAGTTDKPEAKSADEALFEARMLLQEALRNLRNCDVGTVEEQVDRFIKFCNRNAKPIGAYHAIEWTQMPYKEGGEG